MLTGGGDCPGLNAVIRAVVRSSDAEGWDCVGIVEGWRGVVEVMGRHAGWIAVMSGIAGGADAILIPEQPVDYDQVAEGLRKRHARGKNFSIIVVSEGTELPGVADDGEVDQFGHVILSKRGVGDVLAAEMAQRTGFETRVTVLG